MKKLVKESLNESLSGKFKMYVYKFAEELDKIQGNDGFPWSDYQDYVIEEVEENENLSIKLSVLMNKGISAKEAAKQLKDEFDEGEEY